MVIGIIGAGIAGLTAGRELARAGHEVIVFEKSRGFGGRLATRYADDEPGVRYDHGAPYMFGESEPVKEFIDELVKEGVLKPWTSHFHFHDGSQLFDKHPNKPPKTMYCSEEGMSAIGKYLSRWVDVRLNTKVIGFTYLGDRRRNKSPWMINLETSEVFEVDAVVVATPAVQTYGLIENSSDETMFKTVIKDIDTVTYRPKHSLMLRYDSAEMPDFKGITVANNKVITWVANESSKRNNDGKVALVVHSNGDFTRKHLFDQTPDEQVENEMVIALRKLLGDWVGRFDKSMLHLWRYSQPGNYFDYDFVKLGEDKAPVALIGDYMKGQTIEQAYLSGYELGKFWVHELSRK